MTEANLAAHGSVVAATAQGRATMQQWLTSSGDKLILAREAAGWEELVRQDELAANIDAIVQYGKGEVTRGPKRMHAGGENS